MMNDELFCTYEQAIELRELGFNYPCYRLQYTCDTPRQESSLKKLEDKEWIGIPLKTQALAFLRLNFILEFPENIESLDTMIETFIESAKKQQQ